MVFQAAAASLMSFTHCPMLSVLAAVSCQLPRPRWNCIQPIARVQALLLSSSWADRLCYSRQGEVVLVSRTALLPPTAHSCECPAVPSTNQLQQTDPLLQCCLPTTDHQTGSQQEATTTAYQHTSSRLTVYHRPSSTISWCPPISTTAYVSAAPLWLGSGLLLGAAAASGAAGQSAGGGAG